MADFLYCDLSETTLPEPRYKELTKTRHCRNLYSYVSNAATGWRYLERSDFFLGIAGSVWAYRDVEADTDDILVSIADDIANASFAPASLNGSFALIVRYTDPKKWHGMTAQAYTDRMGTFHIYWAREVAVMGTCFRQVADCLRKKTPNSKGLGQYLLTSFFLAQNTWFDEVETLPPATEITYWSDDAPQSVTVSLKRYWNWSYCPGNHSFDDALEEYNSILRNIIDRHCNSSADQYGFGVSGGLDSRNLLGCLPADNRLFAYSYGYHENSIETKISRKLAERHGVPLKKYEVRPYLLDSLVDLMGVSEGFNDIFQARQMSVLSELSRRIRKGLLGHWGDVLHNTMGLAGRRSVSRDELVEHTTHRIVKRGSEIIDDLMPMGTHSLSNVEDIMHGDIYSELDSIPIDDPEFKLKAFKTWQWSFRGTMVGIRVFRSGIEPIIPFYDNTMIDFFQRQPHDFIHDRRMQIAWILRYAPHLSVIEWQETGCDLHTSRKASKWVGLPKRALRKALRSLARQKTYQRNWEVQLEGRETEYTELMDTMSSMPGFPEVNRDKMKILVESIRQSPNASNGYAFSMLFSYLAGNSYLGNSLS